MKARPQSVGDFLAMLPGGLGQEHVGKNFGQEHRSNSSFSSDTQGFRQEHRSNSSHSATQLAGERKDGGSKKYLWVALAAAVAAIAVVLGWQLFNRPTTPPAPSPIVDTLTAQAMPAPQQNVDAPASSRTTETTMVAAYTEGGEYRAYTLTDWDSFSAAQLAKVTPVGVQLSASGQQFIVALTDAGNGHKYKWEDKGAYKDCVDIPGLENIVSESEAKSDFNGRSNTNAILAYARDHGVNYPAAQAAANYSVKGHSGWYLPACGQLWLMCENKYFINKILKKNWRIRIVILLVFDRICFLLRLVCVREFRYRLYQL